MSVPESCVGHREVSSEALIGLSVGQPLSREIILIPSADVFYSMEGNSRGRAIASARMLGVVARTWHVDMRFTREPGGLQSGRARCLRAARIGKVRNRSR
jgi:hypothetical protein